MLAKKIGTRLNFLSCLAMGQIESDIPGVVSTAHWGVEAMVGLET